MSRYPSAHVYGHVSVVYPVHVVVPARVCSMVMDWHGFGSHDPAENEPSAWQVTVPLPPRACPYPSAHVYEHVSVVYPVHVVVPPGAVVCTILIDWH